MRRAASLVLIALFAFCPLALALGMDEDARLPACCRRHGSHHCGMNLRQMRRMMEALAQTPSFTAPTTCSQFPRGQAGPMAPAAALAVAGATPASLAIRPHRSLAASRWLSGVCGRRVSDRGPPGSLRA